jgi:zinc transporter 7
MEYLDQVMRPLPFLAQGLLSTLFISVVPIFFIFVMNSFLSEKRRDSFVHVLLSFALGGLLGDVFFHTMPHIMEAQQHSQEGEGHSHSHDHGHSHSGHGGHGHHHSEEMMQTNLIIVAGIYSFFLIEKVIHGYFEGHSHVHGSDQKQVQLTEEQEKQLRFKKFAVISMLGDLIHNFTDGLSIGVSYMVDYKMGLVTTMAMFFHEIPHEVGDFAILFQLKYSIWQIVGLQCLTGTGALMGAAVGYLVGQYYITECLAFTTGGFLYFSINGLMTEMKDVNTFKGLVGCFMSMSLGLYFMYVFALFE